MKTSVAKLNFGLAAAAAWVITAWLAPTARAEDDPVAYAKQVVDAGRAGKMSRAPLNQGGVAWSGAETSPPPIKNATVAVMPCPLSLNVCQYLFQSAKDAAETMGWQAFPIDNKGDPAIAQRGVEAAINRKVNCVLTLASPARDIRAQIQRGKEQGVAFVTGFSDDPRQYGGDVGYGLDYAAAGQLLGAYIVANSGGGVVFFNAPQLPQLSVRLNGVKTYVEDHGGKLAKVIDQEDYSLAQGAQGQITKMQAVLTRLPKDSFKWVVGPFDEALTPLLETARQRDRTEIKGVAFDGEDVAYDSIRKGGPEVATISWGLEWVAWAGIDECNRALNKAEVGVNKDFPIQLTDKTNVPPPGQKYNIGFDFKSRYKKMWDAARK